MNIQEIAQYLKEHEATIADQAKTNKAAAIVVELYRLYYSDPENESLQLALRQALSIWKEGQDERKNDS